MLWILHWLISREYRLRRGWVLKDRKRSIQERKILNAIFSDIDMYIYCHCGEYADRSRLCEKHKVVLSLGI